MGSQLCLIPSAADYAGGPGLGCESSAAVSASSPLPCPALVARPSLALEADPWALRGGSLKTPSMPWHHSVDPSPRQAVRGPPSGPGDPHAHSAGASLPGASSGPARSAAAAPRSRCLASLLSATWVPPSDRLCGREQKGSASGPECTWGCWRGKHQPQAGGARPRDMCSPQARETPNCWPHRGERSGAPPPPQRVGPVNTAAWIRPSACGLATVPRAGITPGSISCL